MCIYFQEFFEHIEREQGKDLKLLTRKYRAIGPLLTKIDINFSMCVYFQEFFEHIERERGKDLELLARKYRAIGPLLTKMEGLVVHSNTGRSSKLHQYYAFWERKIFDSLTRVSQQHNDLIIA